MRLNFGVGSAIFLLPPLLILLAFSFFYFKDTTGPKVVLTPDTGFVGKGALTLDLSDEGSGLRSVQVSVTQNDKSIEVFKKNYDGAPSSARETFSLDGARLREGPTEIQVTVLDKSLHRFLAGNKTAVSYKATYDVKAPIVSVLSVHHYVNQGGVGLVVYNANEELGRSGVVVDKHFFPGYKHDSGNYVCLFTFPFDLPLQQFQPRLVAADMAGNERSASFYFRGRSKAFRSDQITLSDNFLNTVMPQFEELVPDAKDQLDRFLKVNRDIRDRDVKVLYEIAAKTAPTMLWEGAFLRLPNASPKAGFGDQRSYMYNGQKVDEQRHLGVDLASLANSPVPAANHGKVVWTGFMGIYGNCVFIDHGMGLQSLYAHLSAIEAHVGDDVQKGQMIGRTGSTGMAGGDHLHFGMILHGIPVTPIEWWDPHFIKDNITGKIENPTAAPKEKAEEPKPEEMGRPEKPQPTKKVESKKKGR